MEEAQISDSGPKSQFSLTSNSRSRSISFVAVIFCILFAGAIAGWSVLSGKQQTGNNELGQQKVNNNFKAITGKTVLYGYWVGDSSKINAADLENGTIHEVAKLPSNIKKISALSPLELIFINDTNVRDHGKKISTYNVATKQISTNILASDGFGIDDYVLSSNKRYIATWEVSIPEGQNLDQGRSRVYSVDLASPLIKNLIYDENLPTSIMAHYPLAITDTGEIFLDTFRPNVSGGWANGMSVSSFDGTVKTDPLAVMSVGTYATQPVMSPDGKFLAFAGYDGSKGTGVDSIGQRGGFRQVLLSPNSVEILDTATKTRTKIAGLSNTNRYPQVSWDKPSGKIVYNQVSQNYSTNGQYFYDLATSSSEKIQALGVGGVISSYSIITSLDKDRFLSGQYANSPAEMGNLGDKYAQAITELGVYNKAQNKLDPLVINQKLIQYIDLLPVSSFSSMPVIANIGVGSSRDTTDQLQLQSFVVKPELKPIRTTQQTNLGCWDLASEQCNAMLGTSFTGRDKINTQNAAYNQCWIEQLIAINQQDACSDSPLYLYGQKGTTVNVKIGTPIFNSNAPYNNGYTGELRGDGGIVIDGNSYDSLIYDYILGVKRLPRLDYGKTVKTSEIGKIIREYGAKLGFNDRETEDLINSIGQINSPYVFISYFREDASKVILPISFSPAPDIYRNIVFYLKPVTEPAIAKAPVFEKYPERRGFTAVEVSYIIDR